MSENFAFVCISLLLLFTECMSQGHYENVALNKTCKMSSKQDWNNLEKNAVNGDTSGQYSPRGNCISTAPGRYVWWEVDLGRPYPVKTITLWARDGRIDRMSDSVVAVDGKTCHIFGNIPRFFSRQMVISCSDVINGRVIRVSRSTSATTYTTNTLDICEVQVSSCRAEYWGTGCDHECGQCRDGKPCDKVTGQCDACESGFKPPLCTEALPTPVTELPDITEATTKDSSPTVPNSFGSTTHARNTTAKSPTLTTHTTPIHNTSTHHPVQSTSSPAGQQSSTTASSKGDASVFSTTSKRDHSNVATTTTGPDTKTDVPPPDPKIDAPPLDPKTDVPPPDPKTDVPPPDLKTGVPPPDLKTDAPPPDPQTDVPPPSGGGTSVFGSGQTHTTKTTHNPVSTFKTNTTQHTTPKTSTTTHMPSETTSRRGAFVTTTRPKTHAPTESSTPRPGLKLTVPTTSASTFTAPLFPNPTKSSTIFSTPTPKPSWLHTPVVPSIVGITTFDPWRHPVRTETRRPLHTEPPQTQSPRTPNERTTHADDAKPSVTYSSAEVNYECSCSSNTLVIAGSVAGNLVVVSVAILVHLILMRRRRHEARTLNVATDLPPVAPPPGTSTNFRLYENMDYGWAQPPPAFENAVFDELAPEYDDLYEDVEGADGDLKGEEPKPYENTVVTGGVYTNVDSPGLKITLPGH